MVLLSRQIMKLREREDIDVITFSSFKDLYHISQIIIQCANHESGKPSALIFGIDGDENLVGIPGIEREITNQIHTFMSIFKPAIKYRLETRYNPSDYRILYYLHIKPSLRRFFFPHGIIYNLKSILPHLTLDDFNSTLQDIFDHNTAKPIGFSNLINRFSNLHIEQFSDYKDETKSAKLNRIVDSIHFFESRDELFKAIDNIGLNELLLHDFGLFALKCSARIFTLLDLENDFAKEVVISRLQHLFSIIPEGIDELQSHINFFIRDIILGEDLIFEIEINQYSDLIDFLQVLSAIGISVNLDHVIKHIELGTTVQQKISKINNDNQKLWDDELLAKIFIIFAPYFENNEAPVKSIFRFIFKKKRSNKSKLKKMIEERDRIFRPIKLNGRHDRDNKLAILMKEFYGFECQSCGSKKSSITSITISHIIPLYFGVEMGGIDRSCNMEILCRFCHDHWETKFDKMIFENKNIVSKGDLLEFLKKNFPINFEQSY